MNKFWSSQPVLVIGGNGYLGVEMIQELLKQGALVTSIDRDKTVNPNFQGKEKEFAYISQNLSDFEGLNQLLQNNKFKTCFFLAGFSNIAKARENPLQAFSANVQTLCNLLEVFRKSDNFPQTVVASSNHIYGKQQTYPTPEDAPLNSKDIYGVTKGCGDMIARAYATIYNVPVSVARITNTYGGYEPFKNHLIPFMISEVQKGVAPSMKGDGSSMKGFLYVKDTINGLMVLAKKMERKELWGEAFNFYPDNNMSVLDIVKTILKAMDRQDLPIKINKESKNSGDIEFLSNHTAKNELSWKPEFSLEKGILLSIEDYKKYGEV